MRPLVLCVGERRTSAWANGFLSNEDNHNPEDPGRLPCTSGIAPPPPPRRRILLALSSRDAGRRGRSVCWLWGLWLGGRQGTRPPPGALGLRPGAKDRNTTRPGPHCAASGSGGGPTPKATRAPLIRPDVDLRASKKTWRRPIRGYIRFGELFGAPAASATG